MKARFITTVLLGMLTAGLILFSPFNSHPAPPDQNHRQPSVSDEVLKKEVFKILDMKCNVCHRKQNPFMVFKEKNISKRAKKIYQMVFIERRMPKGNEIQLTIEEYNKLKKWLLTQKIY